MRVGGQRAVTQTNPEGIRFTHSESVLIPELPAERVGGTVNAPTPNSPIILERVGQVWPPADAWGSWIESGARVGALLASTVAIMLVATR